MDADTFIDGCGVVADIPLGRGVRIRFGQGPTSLSVWASSEGTPSGDGGLGETGASGGGASGDTGVFVAGHYGALNVGVLAANAMHVQAHPPG